MRSPVELLSASLFRMRHRDALRLARDLEDRQWWPTADLLQYGDDRARALARHAALNVPFYRERFAALGLDPATMRFPDDWERLPLLDKATLRSRYEDLRATTPAERARGRENTSGGSTGTPVRFLSDLRLYNAMDAFFYVVQRWAGWRPGEPALHFWGGQGEVPHGLPAFLRARVSGRLILPVFSYDERAFASWWRVVERLRPTIIHAYPSVLASFAQWLESERLRPRGVRAVICSAEILFPAHRAVIERAFSCRVYNQYGSRETPCVACECPAGNMHVFVDLNRVEFLDPESGPAGRFLVTPLENWVQPLLRYDLDDLGAPEPGSCSCGRGYPLMKLTVGRNRDHLLAADGRRIYAGFVTRLLDGEEWVAAFQFRQRALGRLELDLVPARRDGAGEAARTLARRILPALREMMGSDLSFEARVVEAIERTVAGKHRYVVNDVPAEALHAARDAR